MGDGECLGFRHGHALQFHRVGKGYVQFERRFFFVRDCGGGRNDHAKMGLSLGSPKKRKRQARATELPHNRILPLNFMAVAMFDGLMPHAMYVAQKNKK